MKQINLGIQVVPILNADECYPIIDACIELIQASGGLVVDIQKPDYELRKKIVETKTD